MPAPMDARISTAQSLWLAPCDMFIKQAYRVGPENGAKSCKTRDTCIENPPHARNCDARYPAPIAGARCNRPSAEIPLNSMSKRACSMAKTVDVVEIVAKGSTRFNKLVF